MGNMDEQPHSVQPEQPEQPVQRMASLLARLDLLEHLLLQYWGRGGGGEQPQLLPGEIPSQLSVEIPLPQESRIVGSVLWATTTTIILDCAFNQEETGKFYEERLTSLGWTKPEMGYPFSGPFGVGGFTSRGGSWDIGEQFCQGERGPSLQLHTIAPSNEPTGGTSVYIMLNTDPEQSPCSPRQRRQRGMMHVERDVLPKLEPPQGAMQLGGGGGGGGDTATSKAWLTTGLALSTAHTHYKEQLHKSGWSLIDSGESGPVAWSTWDFQYEAEGWHGMLMVIAHPWSKGGYQLSLYAEIEGYGQRGGVVFRNGFF